MNALCRASCIEILFAYPARMEIEGCKYCKTGNIKVNHNLQNANINGRQYVESE